MKKYDWSKDQIQKAIEISDNYTEVLRNLNIPISGRNSDTLKRKIKEFNLDISHFTFNKQYKKGEEHSRFKNVSEFLKENTVIKPYRLKLKLLHAGLKENKCECCGISEWHGKIINCQLHHINGDESDNRLENLMMLCPNCHSQTDNYCGSANEKEKYYCPDCGKEILKGSTYCIKCSNSHKSNKPSLQEILDTFKELKSFTKVGNKFGVSDNCIRKWLKSYNYSCNKCDLI